MSNRNLEISKYLFEYCWEEMVMESERKYFWALRVEPTLISREHRRTDAAARAYRHPS
jgi:hypothetical protein